MDEPDMVYHLTNYDLYNQMVLAAIKFDQAVKFTLKTPISFKTTYSGRILANPIWFTTKPTMAFLTR